MEEKSAMVLLVDEEDQIGSRSATAEHSSESEDDQDGVNRAKTRKRAKSAMVNRTGFEIKMKREDMQKSNKAPGVALRGKVLVGEADKVNTESSAGMLQSDEDAREKELSEKRQT